MDLIYDYESDWSSSHSDQGELRSREIREVYLVTYFNRQIPQAEQKRNRTLCRMLRWFMLV